MIAMTKYLLVVIYWLLVFLSLYLFLVDGMYVTFMFNKLHN